MAHKSISYTISYRSWMPVLDKKVAKISLFVFTSLLSVFCSILPSSPVESPTSECWNTVKHQTGIDSGLKADELKVQHSDMWQVVLVHRVSGESRRARWETAGSQEPLQHLYDRRRIHTCYIFKPASLNVPDNSWRLLCVENNLELYFVRDHKL